MGVVVASRSGPSGLTPQYAYDNAGARVALSYWGTGYEFTAGYDAQGRTVRQAGSGTDTTAQQFTFDEAGRLTVVRDTVTGADDTAACTTRSYTFSATSNRVALATAPDASGGTSRAGECTSTGGGVTTARSSFDEADRITDPGYSYDLFGRTLTVPAAHAPGTGAATGISGDLGLSYYANDMAARQTQGGATRVFALDVQADRFASISDGQRTTLQHYTDSTDSPAWSETRTTATPSTEPGTWERYVRGPDGLLAGTHTPDSVSWNLTDLQGSIVATVPAAPNAAPVPGSSYTEYGTPRNPANTGTYGWLGQHQRSLDTLGGLILMGVRLYNPTTGRFLTVDPIYGGNDNPYLYPANPVDKSDLTGYCWSWINWLCKAGKAVGRAGAWVGKRAVQFGKWVGPKIYRFTKRIAGKGLVLAKRIGPGAAILCVVGGTYAYVRSDAQGWIRVTDGLAGCVF